LGLARAADVEGQLGGNSGHEDQGKDDEMAPEGPRQGGIHRVIDREAGLPQPLDRQAGWPGKHHTDNLPRQVVDDRLAPASAQRPQIGKLGLDPLEPGRLQARIELPEIV
jgi:hypothetical protein